MIIFNELVVNNFRCFKGKHTLTFESDSGVYVIHGSNGHGKSTTTNAFRFLFYGEYLDRDHNVADLNKGLNDDAADDGERTYSVELTFTDGQSKYHLYRQYEKHPQGRQNSAKPTLTKDGAVLEPSVRDKTIKAFFPEGLSRFYIFDEQHLAQYQKTLLPKKLNDDIESILGIPILKNALRSVHTQAEKNDKLMSRIERAETTRSAEFGAIETEEGELERHKLREKEMDEELTGYQEKHAELQVILSNNEDFSLLIQEQDDIEKRLKEKQQDLETTTDAMKDCLTNSWTVLLQDKAKATHEELGDKIQDLGGQGMLVQLLEDFDNGQDLQCECPVCTQTIDENLVNRLRQSLQPNVGEQDSEKLFTSLKASQNAMLNIVEKNELTAINTAITALSTLEIKIGNLQDEKDENRKSQSELGQRLPEEELRNYQAEHAALGEKIRVLTEALEKCREDIESTSNSIRTMRNALPDDLGEAHTLAKNATKGLGELKELFTLAIDQYKEECRQRVERDASAFFTRMSREPLYNGVEITNDYRVNILDQDGRTRTGTGGFDQITALSLVGSLQKNTPARMPMIMDGPLAFLDRIHKRKVMQTFPEMSNQVLILSNEAHLSREQAEELLGPDLVQQWALDEDPNSLNRILKEL